MARVCGHTFAAVYGKLFKPADVLVLLVKNAENFFIQRASGLYGLQFAVILFGDIIPYLRQIRKLYPALLGRAD